MATLSNILTNLTALSASVDGIATDVAALNAKIVELQNQTGIPPALQAQIDEIALQSAAVADKAAALDALTPPAV